jgi:putative transposase
MAHTYTNLLVHVIFSTKERVPSLDAGMKPRLFAYIGGIIRELGGVALLINGPSDHVHILALLPAKTAN